MIGGPFACPLLPAAVCLARAAAGGGEGGANFIDKPFLFMV